MASLPATGDRSRLPSLDGLRAFSAAMVVLGHSVQLLSVGRRLPFGTGVVGAWGPIGVSVFFVISGFLITRLLLEERRATGTIRLGPFYLRRSFRILPAYWGYLVTIVALSAAGFIATSRSSAERAFSFTTDYLHPDSWTLSHTWSLSVEEQFYLFWPFLLLAIGARRARSTALILVCVAPLLRVLTFVLAPDLRPGITAMLHLRVDALMIGCWAALEQEAHPGSRILEFLARPKTALCAAVYCLLGASIARHSDGLLQPAIGYTVEAISACSLVLWAISHSETAAGRFLNLRPIAYVGVRAYSLYLWQQLWLSHETQTRAWVVALFIACALLCAEISYRFVEAPMLRMRRKLRIDAPAMVPRRNLPVSY